MKLSFFTFVATLTMAYANERDLQQIETTGDALKTRWEMTEPTISYAEGVFTFVFQTASASNYDEGLKTSFWDDRCKDTTDGVNFEIDYPLIDDPDTPGQAPSLKMAIPIAGTEVKPMMKFKVDTPEFITKSADPNSVNLYTSTEGEGVVNFCVRNGIGYTVDPSPNAADPSTFTQPYQEVNYIETIVRITYDLSAGFDVSGFSVAPKDRLETTQQVDYSTALEAYICVGPQSPTYDAATHADTITYNDASFVIPKKVQDYDVGASKSFNQGSLINICVRVKDEYATQGLRIDEIVDFTFNRADTQTIVGSAVSQKAIENKAPSGNFLTSFNQGSCYNKVSCDFASVLFAQFYATSGTVTGTGNGNLKFYNSRRLGESGKNGLRRLEEDAGPGSSQVDISVPVNGDTEGPGDLKTAGSASIGATAFATVVALVGAIVMA
jgi:hypothetical protein